MNLIFYDICVVYSSSLFIWLPSSNVTFVTFLKKISQTGLVALILSPWVLKFVKLCILIMSQMFKETYGHTYI